MQNKGPTARIGDTAEVRRIWLICIAAAKPHDGISATPFQGLCYTQLTTLQQEGQRLARRRRTSPKRLRAAQKDFRNQITNNEKPRRRGAFCYWPKSVSGRIRALRALHKLNRKRPKAAVLAHELSIAKYYARCAAKTKRAVCVHINEALRKYYGAAKHQRRYVMHI